MRTFFPLVLIAFLMAQPILGQEECGTRFQSRAEREAYYHQHTEIMNQLSDENRQSTPTTIQYIPVNVTIVTLSNGTGGYDQSALSAEFIRLNDSYSSVNLSFYQCSLNYLASDYFYNIDDSTEKAVLKNHSSYVNNVVNLYIVNDITGSNGYAYLPPDRAILVMRASKMSESTFQHEMGHVFGLKHTHDNDSGAELVDGSNCATAGDRICDTPADPNLGIHTGFGQCCPFGCVSFACDYIGLCEDANGDDYDPPVSNFMSYAPGNCRSEFSAQQRAVMYQHALNTPSRQFTCSSCTGGIAALPIVAGPTYASGEFWRHYQIVSSFNMNNSTASPIAPSIWYATTSIRLQPGFRFQATSPLIFQGRVQACP